MCWGPVPRQSSGPAGRCEERPAPAAPPQGRPGPSSGTEGTSGEMYLKKRRGCTAVRKKSVRNSPAAPGSGQEAAGGASGPGLPAACGETMVELGDVP